MQLFLLMEDRWQLDAFRIIPELEQFWKAGILELKLEKDKLKKDDILRIKVNVKNEGNRAGEEVVQLYIRDLVPVENIGFYNRKCEYIVEPGEFRVYVGPDSTKGLSQSYFVTE